MHTGQDLVDLELTQDGKSYIYGYEVRLDDPDPKAFDCSELEQWACHRLGVVPKMPDGAIYQLRHCQNYGMEIEVEDGIKTPGALLFYITEDHRHVATSQGNGKTIEARGKNYGVGQFNAYGRGWTHAALVPGLKYDGWEV